jgi:hypothetical protein
VFQIIDCFSYARNDLRNSCAGVQLPRHLPLKMSRAFRIQRHVVQTAMKMHSSFLENSNCPSRVLIRSALHGPIYCIERMMHFDRSIVRRQSGGDTAARWTLSRFLKVLCISITIHITRSTSRSVQRQYVNASTYNFDPVSSLTSPPPTRSYCLPLLQPVHRAKTSSPPTPGANP